MLNKSIIYLIKQNLTDPKTLKGSVESIETFSSSLQMKAGCTGLLRSETVCISLRSFSCLRRNSQSITWWYHKNR